LRCTEIVKIAVVILLILPLTYSFPVLHAPTLVIANRDTPDEEYAKMIMDKYYLKRRIEVLNDSEVEVFERRVEYIPIYGNNFSVGGDNYLYIEYDMEGNESRYKKIVYTFKITDSGEVDLLGTKYRILNRSDDKVVLYTSSERITTNHSFNFGDYKVVLKLVSLDNRLLIVDIYKDNTSIWKDVELKKDSIYHLEDIILIYEGETGRKYSIAMYNVTTLEDGKEFILDRNFTVSISEDRVSLIYKNPEDTEGPLHILNYYIEMVNDTPLRYFRVVYSNNYRVDLKDRDMVDLGEGAFLIKNNSEVFIFKNGKVFNRSLVEYYVPDVSLDSESLLRTDCNIILVGGPEANSLTRSILEYLKVPITRGYPGKYMGVIQTIKNPYNPKYSITVVAGSDRWGTKACVMALIDGVYQEDNITYVEWVNNTYRILS